MCLTVQVRSGQGFQFPVLGSVVMLELGFRHEALGFRFRDYGVGCTIQGLGFRVKGIGFRV